MGNNKKKKSNKKPLQPKAQEAVVEVAVTVKEPEIQKVEDQPEAKPEPKPEVKPEVSSFLVPTSK